MIHVQLPAKWVEIVPENREPIDPSTILMIVCQYYKVTMSQLQSKTRRRGVVLPRQVAMKMLRDNTTLALREIGERFGDRDHTTVIHSVNTVKDLEHTDPLIKADIQSISQQIRDYGYFQS